MGEAGPESGSAERNRRSIWRVGPESTWTTVVPVAFIIASLLSLVILPLTVSSHTSRMREEITLTAEPARATASQIQVTLAAELDKLIAWQVTGQRQYLEEYQRLLRQEAEARRRLEVLIPRMGGDLVEEVRTLTRESERWHGEVVRSELLALQLPKEVFLTRLYEGHPAYERALHAAAQLETDIQGAIEDRLVRIRDAEQLNVTLTIILTLLALTSAMLVAGLGRQMRLLAREAMRRRQEAEREAADAKAARAAAEHEERRAAFLASAGQELTASLDYQQTMERLARIMVSNLADWCAVDIVEGDGSLRRAVFSMRRVDGDATLRDRPRLTREVPELVREVIRDREPKLVGGASSLSHFFAGDERSSGPMVIAPLVSRGENLGIIAAGSREDRPFSRDDMLLITELARHASLAMDNARLYLESQQAVRAREEVLAIVSHDLRNPLNAVKLGTALLQTSENLGADDREQLDIITVSVNRMTRLIADLLDVTRLEGGKQLPVDRERVEVEALLREADELFRTQGAACNVALETKSPGSVPDVFADRHRIMQVLSNLIGNSLKFTPPGGTISFGASASGDFVEFTVSDTGPGIPAEHLGEIFNPYWQAKRAERLGAGLGLPIARGIVEAHGGEIRVESTPGLGTTFYFTLPAWKEELAPSAVGTVAER